MNRDPGTWISPIVALAVLVAAVLQTLGALGASGAFGWRSARPLPKVPPAYQAIERALDRRDPHFTFEGMRDPFMYGRPAGDNEGRAPVPVPVRPHLVVQAPEPVPVVTAIVFDSDPRALVHWKDRDWTVRQGGLFDEFQVLSITRDQVTLRRGDAELVLKRRKPGE